jgi:hypothetical protein
MNSFLLNRSSIEALSQSLREAVNQDDEEEEFLLSVRERKKGQMKSQSNNAEKTSNNDGKAANNDGKASKKTGNVTRRLEKASKNIEKKSTNRPRYKFRVKYQLR